MAENKVLLEVKNLTKHFSVPGAKNKNTVVHAVENISLFINKGETLGLVGESGCGKSTLGRTILRLHEPTSGEIIFGGETLYKKEAGAKKPAASVQMLPYRKKMQIIFQDPAASLDPHMTVGKIIEEPLNAHKMFKSKAEKGERVAELMKMVGLEPSYSVRYPNEFSGGQQQRVGIARALACNPEFIVCDEPISALDVSIQSQIVNMLEDMQHDLGLTYLFIAHDLSVVRHISNRIGVMYLGRIVELAESYELNKKPLHPYTQTLLSAVPIPDPEVTRSRNRIVLDGDVPSPINVPTGCCFNTRCPYATARCKEEVPELKECGSGHWAACHLVNK
ncbi:MAG: ABC transporter ATP-binding protein [Oscillospiraceae bacterium]